IRQREAGRRSTEAIDDRLAVFVLPEADRSRQAEEDRKQAGITAPVGLTTDQTERGRLACRQIGIAIEAVAGIAVGVLDGEDLANRSRELHVVAARRRVAE